MKERGLLFTGPMVRALLAGTKTQTRRLFFAEPMGPNNGKVVHNFGPGKFCAWEGDIDKNGRPLAPSLRTGCLIEIPCPYGGPGDRLWARETWQINHVDHVRGSIPKERPGNAEIAYLADGTVEEQWPEDHEGDWCWRPSIFMPRWASRITLEITSVRVEELSSITRADARAEGVADVAAYRALWEEINPELPWGRTWVWVVTFRRLEGT